MPPLEAALTFKLMLLQVGYLVLGRELWNPPLLCQLSILWGVLFLVAFGPNIT